MSTTPQTTPEPPANAGCVRRLVHPCADCGKEGEWPFLMNSTVSGHFEHLCPDCREENDPENVMKEPCSHCGGSGREWEGWDCEYCDGTGCDEF